MKHDANDKGAPYAAAVLLQPMSSAAPLPDLVHKLHDKHLTAEASVMQGICMDPSAETAL